MENISFCLHYATRLNLERRDSHTPEVRSTSSPIGLARIEHVDTVREANENHGHLHSPIKPARLRYGISAWTAGEIRGDKKKIGLET